VVTSAPVGATWTLSEPTSRIATFQPSHAGTYVLALVAGNGSALSDPSFVTVEVLTWLPPVAAAMASSTTGLAPLAVCFDASGSSSPVGSALQFAWAFGDGGTSSEANVCHEYAASATPYETTLTVTDQRGMTDIEAFSVRSTQPNRAPAASPTATPNMGSAPLAVQFTANASDPDVDMLVTSWNFGDGATSTEPNPSHVYSWPGTYTAWLTVSDGQHTVPKYVTVAVDSPISIATRTATVKWFKNAASGSVTLWADFAAPVPRPGDLVLVSFDGVQLAAAPFSAFRNEPGTQTYILTDKGLVVRFDFATRRLLVLTPKIPLTKLDNANGATIELMLGDFTAADQVTLVPAAKDHLVYRRDDASEVPE
jgi:PKD repeat protein